MYTKLTDFFMDNRKAALAFSGGVDSSFLFYTAKKAGADIRAYFVKTPFQPEFELEDAKKLCTQIGGDLHVLKLDVSVYPDVTRNDINRCYYCKQIIFSEIKKAAAEDGYNVILDGTNADDDASERPGMAALMEMKVLSPLRLCGYTKNEIRRLSHEAGLFTWNKPAYACLATRIKTGEIITKEKLKITECAEDFLFGLGIRDFRVRMTGKEAKIQVRAEDFKIVFDNREKILEKFGEYYDSTVLDLKTR